MDPYAYYAPDSSAYAAYYENQAGGGDITRYRGQQGFGLGGILRSIIRTIFPIGRRVVKSAYRIAKPHLQAAATELTKEAARTISNKIAGKQQSGGGMRRKRRRRATSKRSAPASKRAKKSKVHKSRKKARRTTTIKRKARSLLNSMPDIF